MSGSFQPTVIEGHGLQETESVSAMSALDSLMVERGRGLAAIEQESELGRGAMGAVLRAQDSILHRPVAMKVMRDRIGESLTHRLRFLEEAQITGQLEHPNIVPVHELGKDSDGDLYFTMKLVQGQSLGQILKAKRENDQVGLSLSELLTVLLKVCDGMAFAHSKNVIHRDLKPDNVMVGDYGEVLVMDWGPARIVEASAFSFLSKKSGAAPAGTIDLGNRTGASPDTATVELSPPGSGGNRVQSVRSDADRGATIAGTVIGTPLYRPPETCRPWISGRTSTLWAASFTRY